MPLLLQMNGELASQGRLASTLKTGQQDDGRPGFRVDEAGSLATEDGDQFLVHDLDDLLSRIERAPLRAPAP